MKGKHAAQDDVTEEPIREPEPRRHLKAEPRHYTNTRAADYLMKTKKKKKLSSTFDIDLYHNLQRKQTKMSKSGRI